MQVENILQSKGRSVLTVNAAAPLSAAISVLNGNRIGAVVVIDDRGGVAGILSERDVVRHLSDDPARLLASPVSAVMTDKVITCTRQSPVADLMETMTRHRIRHIPIVEDGQLVGIVSIGDVVKGKIEEAELEASALREYIAS
jgi:CBS domain-containing protein